MSRTLSNTISTAIAKDATRPVYLLLLSLSNSSPITQTRSATWDTDISWNGQTWSASGIEVSNLSRTACVIDFPLGKDDDWLTMIQADGVRGREVSIYQHYTDETVSPQADAVLVFTGIMDEVTLTDKARVTVFEKSRSIQFPPESIEQPKFNFLMQSGTEIVWGGTTIVVR